MKRRITFALIVIATFIAGVCLGGYWVGRSFNDEYVLRSSAGQASVALGTLLRLRDNRINDAIEIQEIILNGAKMNMDYLAPLVAEKQDTDINRILYQIGDYRRKYPGPVDYKTWERLSGDYHQKLNRFGPESTDKKIGLLTEFLWDTTNKGVLVQIENKRSLSITDIIISYTGGDYGILELCPNQKHQTYICPTSESHIEIEFTDEKGNKKREKIEVYFESNYSGSVEIQISDTGAVNWKTRIKI